MIADVDLNVVERLKWEHENTGLCHSYSREAAGLYYVTGVDDKYKIIVSAYNIANGEDTPPLRVKKAKFLSKPFKEDDCLRLWRETIKQKPRYSYKDGVKAVIPNTFDYWLEDYLVLEKAS